MFVKRNRRTLALLFVFLILPTLEFLNSSIISSNSENALPITFEFEDEPNKQPYRAAGTYSVGFNGINIFNGTNPNANITGIESIDFTRNETWGNSRNQESWNDIIISDSAGNVYVRRGAFDLSDPFSTNWIRGTQVDEQRFYLNMNLYGMNISYIVPFKFPDGQGISIEMLAVTQNGGFYKIYHTDYDQTMYSYRYLYPTSWDISNRTLDTGSQLWNDNVTDVARSEFNIKHLNFDHVVSSVKGKIIIINSESTSDYSEILVQPSFNIPVQQLSVADINVDGYRDIIALYTNGTIQAYLGQSDNTNWSRKINLMISSGFDKMDMGDLDLDGFPDIVGVTSTGQVYVCKNKFGTHSNTFDSYSKNNMGVRANDLLLRDLDRDNDLEMIFGLQNGSIYIMENEQNHNLSLYLDSMHTHLWDTDPLNSRTLVTSYAVSKIYVIDYNEDGWPDIFSGHCGARVYGWKNTKVPIVNEFKLGSDLVISDKYYKTLDFGDIDRDGDMDIICGFNNPYASSEVLILMNPGGQDLYNAGSWPQYSMLTIGGSFISLKVIDLDFDGDLDIVYLNTLGEVVAIKNVYDNSSLIPFINIEWQLHDYVLYTISTELAGEIRVLDIDGNGRQDIIITSGSGNLSALFLEADTTNIFTATWKYHSIHNVTGGYPIQSFDTGDFYNLQPLLINSVTDTDVAIQSDDLFYSDKGGAVSFLPGRLDLTDYGNPTRQPIIEIYKNASLNIKNSFYLYDHARRAPMFLIGGSDLIETYGFISTIVPYDVREQGTQAGQWRYELRYKTSSPIQFVQRIDMNQDGNPDILFSNRENRIFVIEGKRNYYTDPGFAGDPFTNIISVYNTTDYITAIYIKDLDSDGDEDIILSKGGKLVFLRNGFNEDVETNYVSLTVDDQYTASTMKINVYLQGLKWTSTIPVVKITFQGISEYYPMTINEVGKNFSYIYTITQNGTYIATVNITDQFGNYDNKFVYFYGDKFGPVIVTNPNNDIIVKGTLEMRFYNTTESIGNNEIGFNLTNPANKVIAHYTTNHSYNPQYIMSNVLYYLNNGTWWIRLVNLTDTGHYLIKYNATDRFLFNYTRGTIDFLNDIVPPSVDLVESPTQYNGAVSEQTVLDSTHPLIPLKIKFSEDIIYLKYWILNSTNQNAFYHENRSITFVEILKPRSEAFKTYSSEFRVNQPYELYLHMEFIDIAGNLNSYVHKFYLIDFDVKITKFTLYSPLKQTSITESNKTYVHFEGNYIYQFRLRFAGYDPVSNTNLANTWTPWMDNNVYQNEWSGIEVTDGYLIYWPEGDFGLKNVTLEVSNGYRSKSQTKSIEYRKSTVDYSELYRTIGYVIGGLAGVMIVIGIARKAKASGQWKKYITADDGD